MTASPTDDLASAERRIQELAKELAEEREQRTATTEILRVISSSPTDPQRVFSEIAASAARLCDAYDATIFQVDGASLRIIAHYGPIPSLPVGDNSLPLTRGVATARAVLDRRTIHIADLQTELAEYPASSDRARHLGFRTIIAVPLMRAADVIGAVTLRRTEARLFSSKQMTLLESFADQAVIAIENTRLFEAEQASKRELQESLEYQTAMSDVLGVISRSPNELQPVLDTIVLIAQRLCEAEFALIHTRREDHLLHLAASCSADPAFVKWVMEHPIKAGDGSNSGLVLLEKKTVHWPDALAEPQFSAFKLREQSKARTMLGVPVQREDQVVAVLFLARTTIKPFSQRQIRLIETFADQAVIAIENTRLFEAEQASKRELQESLEYQTAISEVLSVMSRSPSQLQPVFDAIVHSASRLCGDQHAILTRYDGKLLHLVAQANPRPGTTEAQIQLYPRVPSREAGVSSRAFVDATVVHVSDVEAEAFDPSAKELYRRMGLRAVIAVPLFHDGRPVGVIGVSRDKPGPFSERQVGLLRMFADQAVIAIENTRLFEEVQARTKELQDSLERQTATSEVLGVISRSPNEVQPVLDTIVATAQRLCQAERAVIWRLEGETFRAVAHHGTPEERVESLYSARMPLSRGTMIGRATLARRAVQVEDGATDPELSAAAHVFARAGNVHTILAVPLLLKGHPIGGITLQRTRVAPFDDKQVALVESFADQAVIAIENSRLFEAEQASKRELTESLEQQTATADVLKVISRSALDVQKVLDALVESAARLCDAYDAAILQVDGNGHRLVAHHGQIPMMGPVGQLTIPLERGSIGTRAGIDRRTIHVADMLAAGDEYPDSRQRALRLGYRTALAVPLVHAGEAIGYILIRRSEVRPFTERQIELVNTFADQAVIAIENSRLFEEVQARTRELAKTVEDLEIASQHKNQFVANMSHELRTPLAAILGYAELIQEGFYEPQGPKSLDALTRIRSNGKHLLGLINTVLDIAKIESGQFTLNMSEYAIESVVETVRAATESLAQNKKLALTTAVDKSLPIGLGDEQRLTQVLLNLVGNAIKFTDAGEVIIAAGARNGHFAVSVTDTGPGIPLDQQDRIFEQFHQVDSSNTKAKGGTGLGLAIAKQIVEMHGGRIWVISTPGKGSTFQMELPTRAEFRKRI